MPCPITASASAAGCQLRLLYCFQRPDCLLPVQPVASADVFKQSDIGNFNLNFDVRDIELEEIQEQDTSVGLFD